METVSDSQKNLLGSEIRFEILQIISLSVDEGRSFKTACRREALRTGRVRTQLNFFSIDIVNATNLKIIISFSLGIRLVLLIRDPRGILQSRKHREWCPTKPDCSDPALVCADMVSDFSAAVRLIKKYPRTFRYAFPVHKYSTYNFKIILFFNLE